MAPLPPLISTLLPAPTRPRHWKSSAASGPASRMAAAPAAQAMRVLIRRPPWRLRRRTAAKGCKERLEAGSEGAQLLPVGGAEAGQDLLPGRSQGHENAPPVGRPRPPGHQAQRGETIDQPDRAVVADAEARGQVAHSDGGPAGGAADGEQGLVLPGGEAGVRGRRLAEAEERAQGAAE